MLVAFVTVPAVSFEYRYTLLFPSPTFAMPEVIVLPVPTFTNPNELFPILNAVPLFVTA